jgi:hypothetical protein
MRPLIRLFSCFCGILEVARTGHSGGNSNQLDGISGKDHDIGPAIIACFCRRIGKLRRTVQTAG